MAVVFLLIGLLSIASAENDLFLNFCGTWRHGGGELSLNVSVFPGCAGLSVSADRRSLSVRGRITGRCSRDDVLPLQSLGLRSDGDSPFCVFWEPLLDTLILQIGGKNLTLCWPARPRDSCCTDLTYGSNMPEAEYGIENAKIRGDLVVSQTRTAYNFYGEFTDCKALCDQAVSSGSPYGNMLNRTVQLQNLEHPCAERVDVQTKESEMKKITSPESEGGEPAVSVQLPPALTLASKTGNASVTFHTNNSLFQDGYTDVKVLRHVVEIKVGNEIISDLSEPIRIAFQHEPSHSRRCVSWDTRKDPWLVNWLGDGCETVQRGDTHTDCLCNHLTYFTVMVELMPRPVRHLLALTVITSLGCALSFISCVALSVYLFRKRRRSKEQSFLIHLSLSVSVGILSLLFFLTGVLANVGGPDVCVWVGALMHYALLCSFAWMGIEVIHTFWLVYMVFSPSPRPYVWLLLGFVLPALPVLILAAVGGFYGLMEVYGVDEASEPYRMCWFTDTPNSWLALQVINWSVMGVLVLSGSVMLFLVYRQIRTRDEWKQKGVAFLSIWGLSVLFGIPWVLAMITYGPAADAMQFLACIFTAFQGFFLMLRFLMLDWMRKQAGGSVMGSSSTGSTRQHMLQAQEKS
ncbi:adhesion G-protein coupled receptor G5-like isoform X2 [Salarias fasciatus]|uniref:adhesion G-protein coupled receptor G5-like isoform X2 n=1 Tax=Salarias fasciatus TaxID=181472 RepID=UPI0011767769|nr:adhesion G-protein coupled receptor G5-like isoform X2 [Salarias fasciatus]